MLYNRRFYIILLIVFVCTSFNTKESDPLFKGFVNPPAEARTFVRWWWNGNHLNADEIKRELDVLRKSGIGGVEINPIAMPEEAADIGTKPIEWISKEWNMMLAFAAKEAKRRGMIADMIVGSGWPFGGEFLTEDETVQRVITHQLACSTGETINENETSLYDKALKAQNRKSNEEQAKSYEILFIRLVPANVKNVSEIIDLTEEYRAKQQLHRQVPKGNYHLVYGFLQKSHREVLHGAAGAAGPVMDHYRKEITLAYLNRLLKITQDTGIPLKDLIRALFCDSIELAGANWTVNFGNIFFQRYGYRLEPFFPFVFYDSHTGYQDQVRDERLSDEIKRVRYDYNRLLVDTFLENFTQTFHDFCNKQGLKSRYQAYGTPFLMGMHEGYLIPDIPESNNWLYSQGADMTVDEWAWSQQHGYMTWNVYTSSAGHLKGRKIISCEAMTNTGGVFKASLEDIKRHDDMNFISGINHSVLHGFNYSPPEAGFPGWVRYGAYFSEQNTWWRYFPKWVDYNSRLSYIFQQTNPVKQAAILAPEGDLWVERGLIREPFHSIPWYCNHLWESLSQAGSSCDYIGEGIIRDAEKSKGLLQYGQMSYQMIILCGIHSLHSATALSLQEFVKQGGKLVILDAVPDRSLTMKEAGAGDEIVKKTFAEMLDKYRNNVFFMNGPAPKADLLAWTVKMLSKAEITPDVMIEKPHKDVFQIRKTKDGKDIFFFVNSHRKQNRSFKAVFPTGSKTPWIWNPENGTKKVFPYTDNQNSLDIELQPLQSLLLVFEPSATVRHAELVSASPKNKKIAGQARNDVIQRIEGPWQVRFEHKNGETFERTFSKLEDFGASNDPKLNSFAGVITYSASFNSNVTGGKLELEEPNRGVTEVYINGKYAGINWYGKPVFDVKGLSLKGKNKIEIKYTTVLSNYCRSLKDNPTANRWAGRHKILPCGLTGDVSINH